MLRVCKTRSSLLAPALLVELAAETGTVLRGMNADAQDDCAVAAAAAVRKAPVLGVLLHFLRPSITQTPRSLLVKTCTFSGAPSPRRMARTCWYGLSTQ